jgi:hypothetical protein
LSAPEREVTSPSDFKVVGALIGIKNIHTLHKTFTAKSFNHKGEMIHRMYQNRDYFGDGSVRFTIRGGRLRYKRYDAHFLKKSSVELPFSSFGDHLINILRKVNRLIYAFKIN